MKHEVECPSCKWQGMFNDGVMKHFGAYCGEGMDSDSYGWEEWDDLICPLCDTVLNYLEF